METKNIVKLVLPVGLTLVTVLLAVVAARVQTQRIETKEPPPDKKMLQFYATEAKKQGRTVVEIPSLDEMPEDVTPEEAARRSTVVVARLVGQKTETVLNDNYLQTWNRFKIEQVVSSPTEPMTEVGVAPAELLPVNDGEFLMFTIGGAKVIDGVELRQNPILRRGQRYFLFLAMTPNGIAGAIGGAGGDDGIYEMDANGGIKAHKEGGLLNLYLKGLTYSVDAVKADMKERRGRD